jgi:hypothetical protein
MHVGSRTLIGVAVLAASLAQVPVASASYDEASGGRRAWYTIQAIAGNIVPGLSALYAPTCLPGYIVCKISFAGVSLIAAGGQWLLSGAQDVEQTRGILHRGFAGDWYLTGRHIAGDLTPQPLPDPPPPSGGGGGGGAGEGGEGAWEPPPI